MKEYIKEILFTTSVNLSSRECSQSKNIDGLIKYKLKKENENLCNKHGYVMKDSVKILNRSVGKLVTHDNNSMIEYGVSMKVDVIYPCEKDIYTCKIDNITKMGVIGYLSDTDNKYNIENSDNSLENIIRDCDVDKNGSVGEEDLLTIFRRTNLF